MRNKLFFFGDYVRTNDDLGRVNRYVLPTAEQRAGDFSGSAVPIYDPLTGDPATGAEPRRSSPATVIPANRISPIAQQILANVPLPNIAGAALGQINYQDTTVRERRTDGFDVKLNYQAVDEGSGVGPLQLPCGRRPIEPGNFAERLRRALPGRLRRHRRQQDATASPATGRAPGPTRW